MPSVVANGWNEASLRGQAKELGYWIVKIIAHQHDYWYLLKSRRSDERIFAGKEGVDYLNLGPLGGPDAVMAAISLLASQKKSANNTAKDEEEDKD